MCQEGNRGFKRPGDRLCSCGDLISQRSQSPAKKRVGDRLDALGSLAQVKYPLRSWSQPTKSATAACQAAPRGLSARCARGCAARALARNAMSAMGSGGTRIPAEARGQCGREPSASNALLNGWAAPGTIGCRFWVAALAARGERGTVADGAYWAWHAVPQASLVSCGASWSSERGCPLIAP